MSHCSIFVVAILITCSCRSYNGSDKSSSDSTMPQESAQPSDSGASADSGTSLDSGASVDSGTSTDSRTPFDSGASTDSGTSHDTGTLDSGGCVGLLTDSGAHANCFPPTTWADWSAEHCTDPNDPHSCVPEAVFCSAQGYDVYSFLTSTVSDGENWDYWFDRNTGELITVTRSSDVGQFCHHTRPLKPLSTFADPFRLKPENAA